MTDATALRLIVEDASGQRTVVPVVLDAQGELTVGRGADCGLRLNERNVSRKHAKLALRDGAWLLIDLGAYNGVLLNGTRIQGQHALKFGDGVRIGDFQLELRAADTMGHEITKPSLLIGNDEGTEPEGEGRAQARKLAEEPTTPGASALLVVSKPHEAPFGAAPGAQAPAAGGHSPTALEEELTEVLPRNEDAAKPEALTPPFAQWLCIMGEQAGRTWMIDRASMVIGRTQDNDMAIDHRSMSRHHAKVQVVQGRYRILDLDSANGLLVNDEAYTETELKHGDVAELGHVKLRFVAPGAQAVLTTEEREQVQAQKTPKRAHKKGRAMPVVAAALLGCSIVGSYAYLARAPEAQGLTVGGVVAAAGNDRSEEEHLLLQARQAIALRNYPRAEALAGAVLELEPSRDEARQILSQCEVEQKGHDALEQATSAAGREDWAQAFEALKDVPKASSANSRAATLMEQVRPALVTSRVNGVKRALQTEHFDEAEHELALLEALQLGLSQVAELRGAIDDAKRGQGHGGLAEGAGGASGASKGRSTSQENRGHEGSSGAGHTGHASADDARQLYADGTRALGQGHNDKAIEALLRCVSQDKNFARCYRALGIAYAKVGNGPKAVRYYRQYLKVDPQAKDAASVKQLLQEYDGAPDHSSTSEAAAP